MSDAPTLGALYASTLHLSEQTAATTPWWEIVVSVLLIGWIPLLAIVVIVWERRSVRCWAERERQRRGYRGYE